MKSFVVMTYYQLMHSVAMALTLDEKPNLYFSMNYMNIKEELLERIRETGVFQNVVGITGRGELAAFLAELKRCRISATRRREMGDDIEGACGQLRRKYMEETEL